VRRPRVAPGTLVVLVLLLLGVLAGLVVARHYRSLRLSLGPVLHLAPGGLTS
jgi:hypothetical protein